ncbi:hypothetical protein DWX33_03375 [Parabacteroides sp. AF19-14]|nr:hypothetical protein DWX33_03375 [Parabacteroides sp. AF19-14]
MSATHISLGLEGTIFSIRLGFMIMMSGICSPIVPAVLKTNHKTVSAKQLYEGIPAWHAAGFFK